MSQAGYADKTADQCRDKAKKLKIRYRKIKDKHGKTGEGRSNWVFLDAMDMVLGDKPSTRPVVLVDTLRDTAITEQQPLELDISSPSNEASTPEASTSFSLVEGQEDEEEEDIQTSDSTKQPDGHSSAEIRESKCIRKKRNREERLEKTMVEVVDRMLKAQASSDSKFAELDEKRIKLEEKLLESEERQRREEKEFILRMWTIMMQGMHATHPGPLQIPPFAAASSPLPPNTGSFSTTSSEYHQLPFLYNQSLDGDHHSQ